MNSAKVYLMKHPMQKHDDPLGLHRLPMVAPHRDGWPAIEAALRQDQRRRRTTRYAGLALAAAASVTLALGMLLQKPMSSASDSLSDQSMAQQYPQEGASAAGDNAALASADTLNALITLSQGLEGRLRALRAGVGDLPASTVVYQVELEDLVVQVDEALSNQPDSLPLWSQRVNLLMDLEQLYENSLRREYRQIASL